MATCKLCGKRAVIRLRYARLVLCASHFTEYFERRVSRTLERYGLVKEGQLVLAAVSGGKDSAAMLAVLSMLAKDLGFEVAGIHLDLGLGAYSRASLEAARSLASKLGVKLAVVSVEKIVGATVPVLAKKSRRPVCSVCGAVKRYILNAAAVEVGADTVALGHTLSDMATYITKEFLRQNLPGIAKLGPKTPSVDGLAVGRIRPLYEVTEKETLVYALVNKIPFLRDECPYVRRDSMDFEIKRALMGLEARFPGTLLGLVRGVYRNLDIYDTNERTVRPCRACGLMSQGEVCTFCRITEKTLGSAMGGEVRVSLRRLMRGLFQG